MKSTGIIRRLDNLGRIIIPKGIRESLKFMEGDALELFVENNSLILKKYDNSDEMPKIARTGLINIKDRLFRLVW